MNQSKQCSNKKEKAASASSSNIADRYDSSMNQQLSPTISTYNSLSLAIVSTDQSSGTSNLYNTCRMIRTIPFIVHMTLFLTFGLSFIYSFVIEIMNGRFAMLNFIYLTHWNLTFQVFFCGMELIADINQSFAHRTQAFRSKLFHSIIFPFCTFVCAFFWTVCMVDPLLVRPANPEEQSVDWYNHVVHTLIVPAVILQSMAKYYPPIDLMESFTITGLFGCIYACWSIMWGITFNIWSYQLFRTITAYGFVLLVLLSTLLLCALNNLGRVLHQSLWTLDNR
ncbi:hypothetical protein BLOT_001041 [Blomia tropicalis]|nr:hypothetical protein BLOT_001041 [Blomia tropicalis]